VVCGPCWAAHGGKPAAGEIGPEPVETAPLRYPSGQRHWLSALKRAEWVEDIRVDGRENLLAIAKHVALAADWTTLESWPGWDRLMAKSGVSETSVQRWVQELKLRGWIVVVETGSTPLTRPMALTLPDGTAISREDGNRRAVYALRIPLSPDEALRWAAESIAAQAAREAEAEAEADNTPRQCHPTGTGAHHTSGTTDVPFLNPVNPDDAAADNTEPETPAEQDKPPSPGDKKGWPTSSLSFKKENWGSTYARESTVVDNLGTPVTDPPGKSDQRRALRAPSQNEEGADWAATVPTTAFQMLVAADWLRRRLPIFTRLTRKAVRAACREFWAAGWSNLDIIHATDHLPSSFGPRAGTPSGPPDELGHRGAWWWITHRLAAWRDANGQVKPGYYHNRGRRKAMRDAVAERHGRASLTVLGDPDLAHDPTLTPEKITAFGRRVAEHLRPASAVDQPRPTRRPAAACSSPHTRAAAADAMHTALAEHRQAEQARAALHARYRHQLAVARAELAARTRPNPATPTPVPAEWEALTPDQRYERARQRAAAERGRHPRHRRHRKAPDPDHHPRTAGRRPETQTPRA
jgi:hypothetical protein